MSTILDRDLNDGDPAELPPLHGWSVSLSERARTQAVATLDEGPGSIVELSILLRIPEELLLESMHASPVERAMRVIDSNLRQATRVRELWNEFGYSGHPFGKMRILGELGVCVVRAPMESVLHFLEQDCLCEPDTPVTGVLTGRYCVAPESLMTASSLKAYNPAENFGRARDLIDGCIGNEPRSYIDYLSIDGLSDLWSATSGQGQLLCCVDSGCDESHPALQQSMCEHRLYDAYGNYKEAKYAVDHGCHGSKVSGASLARVVDLPWLGVELSGEIGLGIAPAAGVAAYNALDGGPFNEGGSMSQLCGAMEDVLHRRRQHLLSDATVLGAYEVCTISLAPQEVLQDHETQAVDLLFARLEDLGIAVILPCGNKGKHASRLGTAGIYVGACDVSGQAWDQNLPGAQIYAPGVDLILTQPSKPQLGHRLIGIHNGTSYAGGVFSGIVLLLCERTHLPAIDVVNVLLTVAEDNDKKLLLSEAIRELE